MTTIPKERKLLMQALDALETCAGAPCVDRAKKAATAAALLTLCLGDHAA